MAREGLGDFIMEEASRERAEHHENECNEFPVFILAASIPTLVDLFGLLQAVRKRQTI